MTLPPSALSDLDLERELAAALAGRSLPAVVEDTARALEERARIRHEHPLAALQLWVNPEAPWDQRRLVAALVSPLTLVLGGNRSGKTYAIMQAAIAFALGAAHPAVAAWLRDNDLPPDLIPDGPGHVCLIAQTGPTSISLHRKKLLEDMVPRDGVQSWMINTPQEARLEIDVPGYRERAVIWFKSVDQGHRKFKGSEFRFAAITEEPEGDEGRLVVDELMRGASSVGGRVVLDMTPQNGMTWVFDDLYTARRYGCQVVELDTTHNVLLPDYESVQRWLASLTEDQRRVRQLGQFVDRRGRIYTEWTRGDGSREGPGHLVAPFTIPPEWPRFRAADFGQVDPTAVLWAALGDDRTLYVYRQYYAAGLDYQEHGRSVRALSAGESYRASVGDPSASGRGAMEVWRVSPDVQLYFDLGDHEVDAGISTVRDWMSVRNGKPRLRVFSDCSDLIREVEGYLWDPKTKRPIKRHDHMPDALRFLVMAVDRWFRL